MCAGTTSTLCIWDLRTVPALCILCAMDVVSPAKVPGATLASERDAFGIQRKVLAQHMRLHRNTLRNWEEAPEVDAIRAAKYRLALQELYQAAVA
jgi:hypothetical protein